MNEMITHAATVVIAKVNLNTLFIDEEAVLINTNKNVEGNGRKKEK